MKELTNGELTVINGGGERGLAKIANGLERSVVLQQRNIVDLIHGLQVLQ